MVPDYQLEDTAKQAAMERRECEPKEHCFKCGKEIEPQEVIEYYDLAFCSQSCLDRAMECPECGEQAEEPGDYCPKCAEKNRIYTMSDAEFWGEVHEVVHSAAVNGWLVSRRFYHWVTEIELIWSCPMDAPIRELIRLFAARGMTHETSKSYTSVSITLVGGKYREL